MNSDAERVLSNLHVLSAVSQNDKLMTNDDQFDIYIPTSARGLVRMWYGEKRGTNMARVRNTVRSAMTIASSLLDEASGLLREINDRTTEQGKMKMDTLIVHHIRMCDALETSCNGLKKL